MFLIIMVRFDRYISFKALVALTSAFPEAVVVLLFIHCLLYVPLFVEFCV